MVDIAVAPPSLAAPLTSLVNRVYADAEKGIWIDGTTRTTEAELTGLIAAGEIAVARSAGRVVGAVRVQRLATGEGEFGMLVAAPEARGLGVGRDLVAWAERRARADGATVMQLELLVPRTWTHPVKEFLRDWYTRIGYRPVRTDRLDADYPWLVPRLATPCDFVVYHKALP